MCDCNATGVEKPDCTVSTTIRQVCQDEVHITITLNSKDLASALSFEPGTYYLISKFLLHNAVRLMIQYIAKGL